jgi:serine/threonine protein kinase
MMTDLQPGTTLEGKYRIDSKLASGGQGHVFRGTHLVLDRPVAIKILKVSRIPEVHARMTKRFEQEARLISSLRDPHTITLYDFGSMSDGSLFMIFEYIDGMSLKELLEKEGKLAPHRVAKILRQTLSSLQEAHSFGVLHRDIKPANIMLYEHANRPDQVKLLDFGIAKILDDDGSATKLTAANAVVGTPRYIAPELLLDDPPTPASDIYSLGLVAYELLVAKRAVDGLTPAQIFRSQVEGPSFKLPVASSIPDGLRSIVDKMLEKQVCDRYASSETILFDLKRWHEHKPVVSDHDIAPNSIEFDPSDLADDDFEHEALTNKFSVQEFLDSMQGEEFDETIDEGATRQILVGPDGQPLPEQRDVYAKETITDPSLAKRLTDPSLGSESSSPMDEVFSALEELDPFDPMDDFEELEGKVPPITAEESRRTTVNDRETRASMEAYAPGGGARGQEQKREKKVPVLAILSILLFLGLTLVFGFLLYSRLG